MRRLITFDCEGEQLLATLDGSSGSTGLLIVSGGNEIRIGAHRGMAELAAKVAEAGHPVFRYDRRGIGDSTGENSGFLSSGPDIAAAVSAFRREVPTITRIVAFGNCDAATALALFHADASIDALVLANPWVIEAKDDLPPPAAIRARYAERMRDPRAWLRLASGGVSLSKLFKGLRKVSERRSEVPGGLAARLAAAIEASKAPTQLLIASHDNTAIAFMEAWDGPTFAGIRDRVTLHVRDTASHSFAMEGDKAWLAERVIAALG